MDSKSEIRSKPILSPTRSLDEGFESDPDRISTDSELATAQTTPAFDVLQRTDRDGVQHTQIARRTSPTTTQDSGSSSSKDSGPESIICLEGEIEKELRTKLEKTNLGRPPTGLPKANTSTGGQQIRYRRIKTRAPPPPIGSYYYQKRSASVDSVNRAGATHGPNSLYNLSLDPGSTVNLHLDLASGPVSVGTLPGSQTGHDVLAGRFVRVTVDPRHHQAQPPASLNQYRLASLSTNNIYKYCHAPAPMTGHYHHLQHQNQQQQQQPLPHHPLHPLSHHHHHHPLHHHHHQTQQQQQHQQHQQQLSMHHGHHHLSYIPTSVASSSGAIGASSSNRNNLYSLPPQYGLSAAAMGSGSHQATAAVAAANGVSSIAPSHSQQSATGSVAMSGGPLAGSAIRNYQHFNHVPVCWTQSIPRQTRR
uniref:Uncharacterized protein n=1 Tax=Anopheles christyi TaxID=43041 RepID=A0A182K475_9DIPT